MVNIFSFGCHVIDRAYVRTYASTDCTGGVGETVKRKGGLSLACLWRVLTSPHLLYRAFTICDPPQEFDAKGESTLTTRLHDTLSVS